MESDESAARALLIGPRALGDDVLPTLVRFGASLLARVRGAGIRIRPLDYGERYRDVSPALQRLALDVDAWSAPPSGLFVVEERRVYLRRRSPMTIAHEFGHAVDCALGGGVYHSTSDEAIRAAFANAREHVTPYAAVSVDEYFAESVRAYAEINDRFSPWPTVSRERLRRLDPRMFSLVEQLLQSEAAS